ncbi:MAG TPA: hypothetical protein DEB39_07010 [Planctomycetaceae bacterium]|nr:hypothetical protein [Planctomycetaceae bacterium]
MSFLFQPAFAFAAEDEKKVEWVLPYFIIMGFMALGTIALVRQAKRSDTSLSLDELEAEKRAQMK